MADIYDEDDDVLQRLLDQADTGVRAPEVGLDPEELKSLIEDEISKRAGPSMEVGDIQMGGGAENQDPLDDWKPAGEESGLDSDLAALLEEPTKAPAPAVPAPKDTAPIVMSESPQGAQQPFGVRDERADLMAARDKVGQLYGDGAPAQASGPGRYEQEFLAQNQRPTNDELRKAWILQSIFGEKGDNFKMLEMVQGMQHSFDQGLARARAADSEVSGKNQRVDRATAEMLVLSGLSPEAAAQTKVGDPVIQLARSGGLNLGARLRGQDTQVLNKNVGETGDVWKTLTSEAGKDTRQDKQLANNIEVAKMRKRSGKGAAAGAGGEDTALLSAFLQRNENVAPETADAFVAGTLDPSDPSYAKLNSAMTIFKGMGGDKQAQLLRGTLGREGGDVDKPMVSASVKQADPVQRLKIKNDLTETGMPLRAAVSGWNSLSPRAKQLAVNIGLQGNIAQLRDAGLSPQEQAAIGAVIGQINQYIKQVSGAAVSNSEWARMGAELGVTGEGVAPFKSPATLSAWLQRASAMYKQHAANVASEYPGLFGGGAQ